MSDTINDFLLGGGGKSASFEAIGDTITGTILSAEVTQQTDIADSKPLFWDDGSPRQQLVVRLQTTQRIPDDPDDDGVRAVYVKGSKKAGTRSLHDAVASAVRAAGAKGLVIGGTLTVTFDGTEPSQTRGFSDRKLYTAAYQPPSAAVSGSFLGTTPTAAAPAAPAGQSWVAPPQPPPTFAAPAPAPVESAPAGLPVMTAEQAAAFAAWQASTARQPA